MKANEYKHLIMILATKLDSKSYRILKELGFGDIRDLVMYLMKHEKSILECKHFVRYDRIKVRGKIAVVCPLCKDIMKIEDY